ncbi:hypothetical protein FZ934_09685 [Rhizobium grahamii]|uniref:histidine kinase n=1 Tax=Rhizobium grahamii TaxID=1120045 RepID=A0A5Q0CAG2_9HYPH|nr:hypothetical protein FZ934_09685 [Rhizobium grahamii]QRM50195.1 hypothetical protein F3Y33_13205 [Rhizobium sp. BG6]
MRRGLRRPAGNMTRILHIGDEARLDSAFSQRLQTWRGTIGLHVACPERCLEEKAPGGSARGTAGEASRTGAENQALRDIPPNVAGAVETAQRTIRDANRASEDGIDDRSRSLLVRTKLESAGVASLEVRDAGVGLDPASVGKLFEPFHSTKPNGMGIGLAICRTIIESHKGRLWASPNDGPAPRSASQFLSLLNQRFSLFRSAPSNYLNRLDFILLNELGCLLVAPGKRPTAGPSGQQAI